MTIFEMSAGTIAPATIDFFLGVIVGIGIAAFHCLKRCEQIRNSAYQEFADKLIVRLRQGKAEN
jgi:hypothetical protein